MQALFNIINKPLGWVLESIAGFFGGNFAAAVFIFTLLINVLLIPLSIKSQKSMVQQTRIKPKLDALKKRYGDDKQKYTEAMQKLYQDEGVSLTGGGCLPMIFRLVLMMSIYWLIMQPLTYLLHIDAETISEARELLSEVGKGAATAVRGGRAQELSIIGALKDGTLNFPAISNKLDAIDFNLFGMDLTKTPEFSFNIFKDAQLIWIMPLAAFASQLISSLASTKMQKKINPDAPSMTGMMLTMPLISLWIGFSLPCGVTFYWACSSLISGAIQIFVQNFYGPQKMLSRERAKELSKQCDFEQEKIKKANLSQDDNVN